MAIELVTADPDTEWIGAMCEAAETPDGDGSPYSPIAIVWFDPAEQELVGSVLCRPTDVAEKAPASLRTAIRSPRIGARVPSRVRVNTQDLADAVRGQAGDIEVVVGPTPEVARLLDSLRITADAVNDRYGARAAEQAIDMHFLAAALQFHSLAPWDRFQNGVAFGVRCTELGIEDGVLWLNYAPVHPGFDLFLSEADATAYCDAIDNGSIDDGTFAIPTRIQVALDEDPPRGVAEALVLWGFPPSSPFALALVLERDGSVRPLETYRLIGVTAILRTLSMLVAEPGFVEGVDVQEPPVRRTMSIRGPVRDAEVTITVPLALPTAWVTDS